MQAVLAWVLTLFHFIPARVLFSLGFGYVSYSGYSEAIRNFAQNVTSVLGSLPSDLYAIASLAGFVDGIGILLSAMVSTAALVFVDRFAKLPS